MSMYGTLCTALVVLVLSVPSCGGAPAATAATPSVDSLGDQATCKVAKDPLNPLIVEWPGTNKVELDVTSQRGVVVVSYASCVLKVLSNCHAGGGYDMRSVRPVRDLITVTNENELYTHLPLGVASLRGELRSAGQLDLEYVAVGQRAATQVPSALSGDCRGATHYVRAITVGAYSLDARGHASGGAAVSVGENAAGGRRREDVRHLRGSGSVGTCEQAQATGCDAILQLGLAPLHASGTGASTPSKAAGVTAVPPQKPTSREGMVLVPAGTFAMASKDEKANEKPVHQVKVEAFWMDVTEVTVGAYAGCVRGGACTAVRTPDERCNGNKSDLQSHPINCVDWTEANAYCDWAGKRLPTEEEWEYGARGSDGRKYPWGNDAPARQLCWNGEGNDLGKGNRQSTCAVGSYSAGRSPFGLHDMAGNVTEWTSSGYSADDTNSGTTEPRVVRGGGWLLGVEKYVRGAYRIGLAPSFIRTDGGFRCVRGQSP
jgi:formylglycine-generating enzyme required for sulfatase activity